MNGEMLFPHLAEAEFRFSIASFRMADKIWEELEFPKVKKDDFQMNSRKIRKNTGKQY